jgi:antitoxin component YwqK of YwqJK toxin-antitoxin module
MKKIIFLVFSSLILLSTVVSAQKQNVYFHKNNGDYLKNADSADFIRMVHEPEKGSKLYLTKEFYISGMRKSAGYSSRIDPPLYEGRFISFYENGRKKQIMSYKKGKITDTAYNHFPNGKLYTTLYYEQSGDSSIVYVKSVNDSTGAAM